VDRRPDHSAHWARLRERLVEELRAEGGLSPASLRAIAQVPRHLFVPFHHRADAYGNHPLPIGDGQTISQPAMVAILCDAVRAGPGRRILEIGTGCGYQAAVLAATGAEVWSVEIRGVLARRARKLLDRLGFTSIRTRMGDGREGWVTAGPFDGIVLTAASERVPPRLLEQLAPDGVLVAPVGQPESEQALLRHARAGTGEWSVEWLCGCRFVPLVDGTDHA
jgi:protein-L-isoaspartate(D-aspartate) O-methyltransferase